MADPVSAAVGTARSSAAADLELVAGVLRRDRKSTAEFVSLHSDAVYGYVLRRLAPRVELADDIVQEVFLTAWERLSDFRGESPLRSWLLGIARHKVGDHYRSRMRELLTRSDVELSVAPLFDERFDRERQTELARRVLAKLPGVYGMALTWRYWERRSTQEIAAMTGKTEKSIERLLARARRQFKKRWNDG